MGTCRVSEVDGGWPLIGVVRSGRFETDPIACAAMSEPTIQTTWTREQVERMLEVDDFKYHDIALPYGLSTGGYDRLATARSIFPEDMTGKSVLDLGSKFGYFCFEAIKRGADGALPRPGLVRGERVAEGLPHPRPNTPAGYRPVTAPPRMSGRSSDRQAV